MTPYYDDGQARLYAGDVRDVLRALPEGAVQMCVTSPPYWGLRDYGVSGQLGLEPTPEEYVANMVEVFREVRRVLRDDGTLWLNIGDSYTSGGRDTRDPGQSKIHPAFEEWEKGKRPGTPAGCKPKDLVGIPWMLAFALRADGWYLRQDIIWSKPNPMPESVRDRCTKAHEYVFLLSKSARYWSDFGAIREPASPNTHARLAQENLDKQLGGAKSEGYADQFPGKKGRDRKPTEIIQAMARKAGVGPKAAPAGSGVAYNESLSAAIVGPTIDRNKRSVWHIPTQPFPEAHFATFPEDLVKPCVLAGCPEGGVVLDPFIGSGTTAKVAKQLGRYSIGIDLNTEYLEMAKRRIAQMGLLI